MRIALLSTFHPYRGGIAQFNASLLEELGRTDTVKAFNFKRQYPGLLFPGKSQYVDPGEPAPPVESERVLDSVNPFTWGRTARHLKAWGPDLLLMKYWMPWFAPSLGYAARRVRAAGCKVVPVLDNVIPHERRPGDITLTKYFLRSCSGFVTMSDSVTEDLLNLKPDARYVLLPHPLYSHFGEKLGREEAAGRLGIDPRKKTLLFFGLIREYKGLDILLEAFRGLGEDYQLVVAGEPYGSFERYQSIIDSLPGKDRIKLVTDFIPDEDVKLYFSAADVTVLPYRTATQSGISAISFHFEVPMIVTSAGGLGSTVSDKGTGLSAGPADSGAVRDTILRFFSDPAIAGDCTRAIRAEKDRLSWSRFASDLRKFVSTL